MAKSVSYAASSRETNIMMILVEGDTVYDTDFAMFYTLYHIFKQESIQGIHYIIYLNRRVYRVFIISYSSTMPLIIHVYYENVEFCWEFEFFF